MGLPPPGLDKPYYQNDSLRLRNSLGNSAPQSKQDNLSSGGRRVNSKMEHSSVLLHLNEIPSTSREDEAYLYYEGLPNCSAKIKKTSDKVINEARIGTSSGCSPARATSGSVDGGKLKTESKYDMLFRYTKYSRREASVSVVKVSSLSEVDDGTLFTPAKSGGVKNATGPEPGSHTTMTLT